ncbi:plasmid replicase [bacterium M00.F.Ca.ET.230.01.1.1]|jgi:hypothetical protein|nr:plasmid replicase [bacterium M00.F.Ca.ET.230.01.1.1]
MKLLQKINPHQWETIPELASFYADLPTNPYCTDEKGTCYPRHKKSAIQRAYIQPNHPHLVKWLAFDIDSKNALFAYHDNNLPRPQLIGRNRENGHAHYLYKLTVPVALYGNSHLKPIEYMRAVYRALATVLGADPSYGGNLIKSPFSPCHDWYITGADPSYSLDDLASYLDLSTPKATIQHTADNDDHFGRNCATFHHTRHIAYKIADKFNEQQLLKQVLAIAEEFNAKFDNPMLPNETYHIARSITRFCKSPRWGKYNQAFIEKQRQAGQKGDSSQGGKARSASYDDQRTQAQNLRATGLSIRKIAEQMKVSKTSVQKWIKVC